MFFLEIMNKIILITLLFIPSSWKVISEKNNAIDEAAATFSGGEYEASVRKHLALFNDFEINSNEAVFDLAMSYQYNGQEEEAQKKYSELMGNTSSSKLASFSANQKGVILGNEEKYEDALQAFKHALIKNPNNEQARYNYELLSRWLAQNEDQKDKQQDQSEDQQEPSNYAKRMKAEADKLVDQFKFKEALGVMNRALEIDETVSHYQEFINNLGEINEINEN